MATITTLTIKDGANATRTLRALDFSGAGTGPFLPLHSLADEDGAPISALNPLEVVDSGSSPGGSLLALTYSMTSDSTNLEDTARSMRVYNGTNLDVTLMVLAANDTVAVPLTVPANSMTYEPVQVKRILRTGSVNFISGGDIISGIQVTLVLP